MARACAAVCLLALCVRSAVADMCDEGSCPDAQMPGSMLLATHRTQYASSAQTAHLISFEVNLPKALRPSQAMSADASGEEKANDCATLAGTWVCNVSRDLPMAPGSYECVGHWIKGPIAGTRCVMSGAGTVAFAHIGCSPGHEMVCIWPQATGLCSCEVSNTNEDGAPGKLQ
eukprot:CAMPEP_0179050246 /NCGR_PEP_ID=MMETSP0796-20121207/20626_1 /TAXON_ID=73915 /ORGANISM="Pyrodinium bahamense, Strain pbaha01" /LENGTH=172 /DNA_ID=CAMNT_0020746741 /DNA_START=25 /DNA_END=543 /DNA_ORIENTATION=-